MQVCVYDAHSSNIHNVQLLAKDNWRRWNCNVQHGFLQTANSVAP